MSLHRLKHVLLPKVLKPPPPEMLPFLPDPGEPVKVTTTQVRTYPSNDHSSERVVGGPAGESLPWEV